ncbi:hypothetical protein Ccrd_025458 [Cynara cardunculus var. scolymus]|uniref:Uncharacterized protein n=1 Tax=Cynara cardunculus var. scolymus TaxID=59895 RepID=A0A103X561_CYNCS|nr:hypothetical protein Ccrd_025458 [Cynara cardunculus var. scolymus]
MSMQHEPPEPKRSKARDNSTETPLEESPEAKNRKLQRELMAAAAEKRMMAASAAMATTATNTSAPKNVSNSSEASASKVDKCAPVAKKERCWGEELSSEEAQQLFLMVFGNEVSKGILAQWNNQGIRFSPDEETSMGLVQHEATTTVESSCCLTQIWLLSLKSETAAATQ